MFYLLPRQSNLVFPKASTTFFLILTKKYDIHEYITKDIKFGECLCQLRSQSTVLSSPVLRSYEMREERNTSGVFFFIETVNITVQFVKLF